MSRRVVDWTPDCPQCDGAAERAGMRSYRDCRLVMFVCSWCDLRGHLCWRPDPPRGADTPRVSAYGPLFPVDEDAKPGVPVEQPELLADGGALLESDEEFSLGTEVVERDHVLGESDPTPLKMQHAGSGYEYFRSRWAGEDNTVYVHQLLAIADGHDPYEVFEDGVEMHHELEVEFANVSGEITPMEKWVHANLTLNGKEP